MYCTMALLDIRIVHPAFLRGPRVSVGMEYDRDLARQSVLRHPRSAHKPNIRRTLWTSGPWAGPSILRLGWADGYGQYDALEWCISWINRKSTAARHKEVAGRRSPTRSLERSNSPMSSLGAHYAAGVSAYGLDHTQNTLPSFPD